MFPEGGCFSRYMETPCRERRLRPSVPSGSEGRRRFIFCLKRYWCSLFFFDANSGLRVKMCVWLGVLLGLDLAFLDAD